MAERLHGMRTLVTGAGSNGIGRAIVGAYCREGAKVVAHYHPDPMPSDVGEALAIEADEFVQIAADFSDPLNAQMLVEQAIEQLGGLDVVVANAGIMRRTPFLDITHTEFQAVLDINLTATFLLAQRAAKHMVEKGSGGRIIIVSSVNQEAVVAEQSHYCASKGGLKQLARAMALELGPFGINVNLIAPGAVETDMVRDKYADADWAKVVGSKHPLGRHGRPRDFEGVAVFLASAESEFITGSTIVVDGGFTLRH